MTSMRCVLKKLRNKFGIILLLSHYFALAKSLKWQQENLESQKTMISYLKN